MVCVAAVLGAIWLATINDRRNRQLGNPAPESSQVRAPSVGAGIPTNPKFRQGAQVELIGSKDGMTTLCADEAIFLEYQSKTRKFIAGRELFGVDFSTLAEVLVDKGDRLQVKILEGAWKGRIAWLAPGEARLRPTAEDAAKDVVDGLTQDKRREIYAELHRIGMLADFEGFHQIPIEGDPVTAPERNAKRKALIADLEKKGRAPLIARYRQYRIDWAQLDRIDKEGEEKRWPIPHVADPYRR
jgi:hypothetical protein